VTLLSDNMASNFPKISRFQKLRFVRTLQYRAFSLGRPYQQEADVVSGPKFDPIVGMTIQDYAFSHGKKHGDQVAFVSVFRNVQFCFLLHDMTAFQKNIQLKYINKLSKTLLSELRFLEAILHIQPNLHNVSQLCSSVEAKWIKPRRHCWYNGAESTRVSDN
jgi:hypothetical protein